VDFVYLWADGIHVNIRLAEHKPCLQVMIGVRVDGRKELVAFESAFATVRHRTKATKGPGSRVAGLAMAFKLIESAQIRWRAVNAPHLVTLVRTDAAFVNGMLVERPEAVAATPPVETAA
jgi:hypothetical protein